MLESDERKEAVMKKAAMLWWGRVVSLSTWENGGSVGKRREGGRPTYRFCTSYRLYHDEIR